LLGAWKTAGLANSVLWIAGPGELPNEVSKTLPSGVSLLGKQDRGQLAALMQKADAFVFPSNFEGMAIVQIEAMASGLPLIATRASGAEGLVEDGLTGFIIAAGNEDALADRMRRLATDAELLTKMKRNVMGHRDFLSWKRYGDQWLALLPSLSAA
jgi:glycosyltransferase involved in cell wall biosynthesis